MADCGVPEQAVRARARAVAADKYVVVDMSVPPGWVVDGQGLRIDPWLGPPVRRRPLRPDGWGWPGSGLRDAEVVPAQIQLGVDRVGERLDARDAVSERVVTGLEYRCAVRRQAQRVADAGTDELEFSSAGSTGCRDPDLDVLIDCFEPAGEGTPISRLTGQHDGLLRCAESCGVWPWWPGRRERREIPLVVRRAATDQ